MLKQLVRPALILLLIFPVLPLQGCGDDETQPDSSASCVISENLDSGANDFISRCRKAGIRQEFPSEYLDSTLAQIRDDRSAQARKAWKLLTNSRFIK